MIWGKEWAVITAQGDTSLANCLAYQTRKGWSVAYIKVTDIPVPQQKASGLAIRGGHEIQVGMMVIYHVVFWRFLLPWRAWSEARAARKIAAEERETAARAEEAGVHVVPKK